MEEYHIDNNFKSKWRKKILNWYLLNKRDLPWRKPENQNFYKVWISEIMLQQTQVSVVIPYYNKFLTKWPTLEDFFDAELEEILLIWQGMGYYKRAHNLFKAKELLKKKKEILINSIFLKEFPGIGDYTSSAISAILKNEPCAVVDGNIKRILSRVFSLKLDDQLFEKKIKDVSILLTPKVKNGEYCQALMDIANLICKVKNPDCNKCPILALCKSKGILIKPKRKIIPVQKVVVAFVVTYQESFLVEKNTKKLLQNLFCFPLSEFKVIKKGFEKKRFLDRTILKWFKENKLENPYKFIGEVTHKFSHFQLKVLIVRLRLSNNFKIKDFVWLTKSELNAKPVSKLMLKIKEHI